MKAIPCQWYLCSNVLVTDASQVNPNETGGLTFIPASVLRGALIEKFKSDLTAEQYQTLFFSDEVKFLNAYPSPNGDQRTIPTPFCLQQSKTDQDRVYNLAVANEPQEQLRRMPDPYCHMTFSVPSCYGYQPEMVIRLHNTQPPDVRTSMAEAQVFSYVSLHKGLYLCGWIISENSEILDTLWKKWNVKDTHDLYIGRSRRTEYGHAQLRMDQIQHDWHEIPPCEHGNNRLVVTLLSDCIIRDPATGAFSSKILDMPKSLRKSFTRMKLIGGNNRWWNMPLPQCWAIAAGSVFVYEYEERLEETLRMYETGGVGERTVDGFGRIALNYGMEETYQYKKGSLKRTSPENLEVQQFSLNQPVSLDARRIMERIYLQRARAQLQVIVQQINYRRMPSNAQLQHLCDVVQRQHALLQESMFLDQMKSEPQIAASENLIIQFLDNLTGDTREKYRRARVEACPLDNWLHDRLDKKADMSALLHVKWNEELPLAEIPQNFQSLLTLEYIYAVLQKVLKERKKAASEVEKEVPA